jgi:hypothetical protein
MSTDMESRQKSFSRPNLLSYCHNSKGMQLPRFSCYRRQSQSPSDELFPYSVVM